MGTPYDVTVLQFHATKAYLHEGAGVYHTLTTVGRTLHDML